ESEPEAHDKVDQVAQHDNTRPSDPVAELADEWCSEDERGIEQRIKQYDIPDRETDTIRTQKQEAETEVGQRENPRCEKVAVEPGTQRLPCHENTFVFALNARLILDQAKHENAQHGRNKRDPEQHPKR